MRISLNTIKQYIDFELPPLEELVERINTQLGGVEATIDLADKYKDAVIVRVMECDKHPDADKLSVTKIDDNGVMSDVPRDENGYVQVVCGAPNVRADMLAVWLPPNSTVPSTYDDSEPFVLGARALRGVMSQGMLAAADELAIGSDHDGILEIDPTEAKPLGEAIAPGVSFAKAFGLDDTIIDIENKMFTHRPDLFGQLGVVREIRSILSLDTSATDHSQQSILEEDWFWQVPGFGDANELELEVYNDALDKAPRFMAVAMSDVEVKPSPLWLQCELVRWGGKPINNVVDMTNYIMLLTAQPTHAYDYDKLRGSKLGVRMASSGEEVTLLNGKTYKLDSEDIVIADGEGVIGLAGIMGGGNSEVSADTKNIVLEVASFGMYDVRRSSMRHGLFTDALTRFNKGQSKLQNDRVLTKLISMMSEYAGAKQASKVFDVNDFDEQTNKGSLHGEMTVGVDFINQRLGSDLSPVTIGNILRSVNLAVRQSEEDESRLVVTAPFWRTDIELPEDIVEEVGRLYGFSRLPRELPVRSIEPAPKNANRELAKKIRDILSRAGANEVLTYSFVNKKVLERAGQNPDNAYSIANALSPDLQYYRLSLTPSLLDKVHSNIKAGHDEFALFEIGKGHTKGLLDDEGLPREQWRMALTLANKKGEGSSYYQAKYLLEYLAKGLGLKLLYRAKDDGEVFDPVAPFELKRSAQVVIESTGEILGLVGEYKSSVKSAFRLPDYAAGFEIAPNALLRALDAVSQAYKPLSRYPSTSRDISFRVAGDVTYGQVLELAEGGLSDSGVDAQIEPRDIYQADGDDKKTITISVKLTPYEKTLASDEANLIIDRLTANVVQNLAAEII